MNSKIIAVGAAAMLTAFGCDNYSSNGRSDTDAAPYSTAGAKEMERKSAEKAAARGEILREADRALALLYKTDPSMEDVLKNAKAYAVFPMVTKGAAAVGGAHGKGVLFEGGMPVGYTDLVQASVGLQLGGQTYSEVIVFSTNDAVSRLKMGKTEFDAQVTAVALKSGEGANAQYRDGVAVFTFDEAGLMVEASVGGQTFSYEPK